jgi:hypothetical protein
MKRVNFDSGAAFCAAIFGRILPLTGLPVRIVFRPAKCRAEASKEMKTRSTNLPRIRLLNPGKAFCSWMAVLLPIAQAVKTTGPEAYPPTPKTRSGLKEWIRRHDWKRLLGMAMTSRSFLQKVFPCKLPTSIVLKR